MSSRGHYSIVVIVLLSLFADVSISTNGYSICKDQKNPFYCFTGLAMSYIYKNLPEAPQPNSISDQGYATQDTPENSHAVHNSPQLTSVAENGGPTQDTFKSNPTIHNMPPLSTADEKSGPQKQDRSESSHAVHNLPQLTPIAEKGATQDTFKSNPTIHSMLPLSTADEESAPQMQDRTESNRAVHNSPQPTSMAENGSPTQDPFKSKQTEPITEHVDASKVSSNGNSIQSLLKVHQILLSSILLSFLSNNCI